MCNCSWSVSAGLAKQTLALALADVGIAQALMLWECEWELEALGLWDWCVHCLGLERRGGRDGSCLTNFTKHFCCHSASVVTRG